VEYLQELLLDQSEIERLNQLLRHMILSESKQSDLQHMLDWIQKRLTDLEKGISIEIIAAELQRRSLFPDPDDLAEISA
jgi:hypothetical protein